MGRSTADWDTLIESYQLRGQTVKAFCREQHLSPSSLYQHKTRVANQHQGDFIKANITPNIAAPACFTARLDTPAGALIFSGHVPADYLLHIIKGLLPC